MPAEVSIEQFWSLIIYDLETFAFIYNPFDRTGLSSFDLPNMQKNNDGSVTIYFGSEPPEGMESNWIPTEVYSYPHCQDHEMGIFKAY